MIVSVGVKESFGPGRGKGEAAELKDWRRQVGKGMEEWRLIVPRDDRTNEEATKRTYPDE